MNVPAFYTRHIFFCERSRESGDSCAATGGPAGFERCRERVRELGLAGPGQIRVNRSGCLDRCGEGPVAVVYPEAVWYTFVDEQDIDEIVESHLRHGRVVERLRLPPPVDA
jgi:(2Fe-2S) ferredoxin